MSPRKRTPLLDKPPCPVCGVAYADWRGEYPGGFKGALSGHKASAWAMHCERCEDYPAGAADFDPAAFAPLDPDAALVAYVESVPDDDDHAWAWGAPMDEPAPVAAPVRASLPVLGPFDAVPWL